MNLKTSRNAIGRQSATAIDEFVFSALTAVNAFAAANLVVPQNFGIAELTKTFEKLPVATNTGPNEINFLFSEGAELVVGEQYLLVIGKGYNTNPAT